MFFVCVRPLLLYSHAVFHPCDRTLPPLRLQTAVRSLAVGGRYLVVGFASGTIPAPPLNLVLLKEACVMGVFWGAWREREPEKRCEA